MNQLSRLTLLLILCLSFNTICYAETTEDLYDVYNIPFSSSLSDNVVDTIHTAEAVKIDAMKYANIIGTHKPNSHTTEFKAKLDSLSESLALAGKLSYSEVISLESEYLQALNAYNMSKEIQNRNYKPDIPSINSISINEYEDALHEYNKYKKAQEIGHISSNNCPVRYYTEMNNSDNITTFLLYEPTQVLAPFTGTIASVSNNTIDIALPDNIDVRLRGVDQCIVEVGDKVYQSQVLGVARGTKLIAGLKLNGVPVSFEKLVKGKT